MTFRTSEVAVCWSKDFAQLAQEPRVLDGDDGLGGKILYQINLFASKRAHLMAVDDDRANRLIVLEHRHREQSPRTRRFDHRNDGRVAFGISVLGSHVDDVLHLLGTGGPRHRDVRPRPDHRIALPLLGIGRSPSMKSNGSKAVAFAQHQSAELGFTDASGVCQHRVKYRLEFARRSTDDLQHL